jgi:hypothetical protein
MPSTLISTREGWIQDPKAVLDAVQSALTETVGTPPEARHLRLIQFPANSFTSAPGEGDRYTLIEVTLFSGRTPEIKQSLYAALKRNFAPLGVPAHDVKVILYDTPRESWS